MATTVLCVPGTFETTATASTVPTGLLGQIPLWLASFSQFRYQYITYTALYGNGVPYTQSKADGISKLNAAITAAINADPNGKIALAGYSQGADIVGDVAWQIGYGTGVCPASRISCVGLIGDPGRRIEDNLNSTVYLGKDSHGIAQPGSNRTGGWADLNDRVFTYCNPGDIVCDIEPSDPDEVLLPLIASDSSKINLADPGAIAATFSQFVFSTNWLTAYPQLAAGPFGFLNVARAIQGAINVFQRYSVNSPHTQYHIKGGMSGHSATESLSQRILERS